MAKPKQAFGLAELSFDNIWIYKKLNRGDADSNEVFEEKQD